jgi:hypothetical protein
MRLSLCLHERGCIDMAPSIGRSGAGDMDARAEANVSLLSSCWQLLWCFGAVSSPYGSRCKAETKPMSVAASEQRLFPPPSSTDTQVKTP